MVMKREDQVVSEVLLEGRCDVHEGGGSMLCQKSYWRGDVMFMKEGGACCVRAPIRVEM